MARRVLIPPGLVDPNATAIIDIPDYLGNEEVLIAQPAATDLPEISGIEPLPITPPPMPILQESHSTGYLPDGSLYDIRQKTYVIGDVESREKNATYAIPGPSNQTYNAGPPNATRNLNRTRNVPAHRTFTRSVYTDPSSFLGDDYSSSAHSPTPSFDYTEESYGEPIFQSTPMSARGGNASYNICRNAANRTRTIPSNQTYNVPGGNQTYNVPSLSETYNVPAGNQTYNVPSLSETYNVPAGNRTYNVPSLSETYNVPSGNQTYNVPGGNQTYNVPGGNQTYNVPGGNQTYNLPGGNQTYNVPGGNQTYNVPGGNQTYNVPGGNQTYNVPGGNQTYNVPSLSETYNVPGGNQTYNVPGGNQTYNVPGGNQTYNVPSGNNTYNVSRSINRTFIRSPRRDGTFNASANRTRPGNAADNYPGLQLNETYRILSRLYSSSDPSSYMGDSSSAYSPTPSFDYTEESYGEPIAASSPMSPRGGNVTHNVPGNISRNVTFNATGPNRTRTIPSGNNTYNATRSPVRSPRRNGTYNAPANRTYPGTAADNIADALINETYRILSRLYSSSDPSYSASDNSPTPSFDYTEESYGEPIAASSPNRSNANRTHETVTEILGVPVAQSTMVGERFTETRSTGSLPDGGTFSITDTSYHSGGPANESSKYVRTFPSTLGKGDQSSGYPDTINSSYRNQSRSLNSSSDRSANSRGGTTFTISKDNSRGGDTYTISTDSSNAGGLTFVVPSSDCSCSRSGSSQMNNSRGGETFNVSDRACHCPTGNVSSQLSSFGTPPLHSTPTNLNSSHGSSFGTPPLHSTPTNLNSGHGSSFGTPPLHSTPNNSRGNETYTVPHDRTYTVTENSSMVANASSDNTEDSRGGATYVVPSYSINTNAQAVCQCPNVTYPNDRCPCPRHKNARPNSAPTAAHGNN